MTHHFVLSIHPDAQHDWDKCVLRNPITGERPDFTEIIADAVANESGAYLVCVKVEVTVLEKAPLPQNEEISRVLSPIKTISPHPKRQEWVAS
jgi:hypothetical protein